ncbi:MAG: FAD:protein FMN transferase [Planctomycetes bacterium]|nr:FAD:protein FMN transferase [Planctomycetota bacterium]
MSKDSEKQGGRDLPEAIASSHHFCHEAMTTAFEIYIAHDDREYAEQAAGAAFRELDRLEHELSRFVENSDVARINNLRGNSPLVVGDDVFECLSICEELYEATFGAFDITVGSLYECWFGPKREMLRPGKKELAEAKRRTGMGLVKLNADEMTVEVSEQGVKVDLGAIGKGFAIDKMGEVLKDWSIAKAFIHSGSTIFAMDKCAGTDGWPITLSLPPGASGEGSGPEVLSKINLENIALSGSNQEYGRHIIDPRIGRPVEGKLAAWARSKLAGRSDGLSTALMVMSDDEAKKYFEREKQDAGMVVLGADGKKTIEERILKYGSQGVF